MLVKRLITSKILILLLLTALFIGQFQTGILAAVSNPYENFNISISKTIENTNIEDPGKYYLGQLVKATYTITSNEVELVTPKEIAFVIDLTTSMAEKINGTNESKISALKKVFVPFLDYWKNQNTRVCVVGFSGKVTYDSGLMEGTDSNIEKLKTVVNGWSESTLTINTNLGDGLRRAYYNLLNSGNADAKKYIITLTDGMPNTHTVDSNNQYYYGDIAAGNSGITTITSFLNSSQGIEYACGVMSKILPNSSFKNFMIGFGIEATQATNLNVIGKSGGLDPVGDVTGDNITDYFYRPTTSSELSGVLTAIADSIGNEILLTTAKLYDTTSDNVTLPTEFDLFRDIPPALLKGDVMVDPVTDASGNEIGKSNITIPLNLKLVRVHDNFFAIEKITFSLYYRVASTGQIAFPQPSGEFAFTDPLTGTPVNKSSSGNTPWVSVKQTVDSVYIPPKIMFSDEKGNPNINAFINPKSGLDIKDKYIINWVVTSGSDLLSITDGPDINDSSAVINLKGKVGVAEVMATSSGPGFGGTTPVDGYGKVIIIKPSIDKISVDVGKSANTGLKLDMPVDLIAQISNIMKDHVKKQTFDGFSFKICPLSSGNVYSLGVRATGYGSTSPVFQSESFTDYYGNWIITPFDKDGERYYQITNKQNGNNLSALSNSIVRQAGNFDPSEYDYQLWKIEEMEDGYYRITSKFNGKCLQIRNRKNVNGVWEDVFNQSGMDVITGTYNGYQYQKWSLKETDYIGSPSLLPSVLNNIEIDKNPDGSPAAYVDTSTGSKNNAVKIAFALKQDGTPDYTKLNITGRIPTTIIRSNDTKVLDPVNVIVSVSYKNIDGIVSKTNVRFPVEVIDRIDLN